MKSRKEMISQNGPKSYTMKTFAMAALTAASITLVSCGGGEPETMSANAETIQKLEARATELKASLDMVRDSLKTLNMIDNPPLIAKVRTAAVEVKRFSHFFEVQGNVEADKNVMLYAEMGGNIKRIHVSEGDQVSAGQTIVTLDTEVISKNIKELEKSMELAEFMYKKQKNLWEQNIGSELQYVQAKNQKESLESKLSTLKSQRAMSIITAPFAGTIDEIFPNEGEMAGPGMPVVRLLNLNKVTVVADVTENYLGNITPGKFMQLELPSMDGMLYDSLAITRVGKFINPNNRTFRIQVDIDNGDGPLVPNLIAIMRIRDYVKENSVVVPSKYILQESGGNEYVYLLEDGIVVKRDIARGKTYTLDSGESEAEILTGLEGGEVMITEGAKGVLAGQEVEALNMPMKKEMASKTAAL